MKNYQIKTRLDARTFEINAHSINNACELLGVRFDDVVDLHVSESNLNYYRVWFTLKPNMSVIVEAENIVGAIDECGENILHVSRVELIDRALTPSEVRLFLFPEF